MQCREERGASEVTFENWVCLAKRYPGGVGLLIGLGNPLALCPFEVKRTADEEPFLMRIRLEWNINGPLVPIYRFCIPTFLSTLGKDNVERHTCSTLKEQVRLFWKMEEPKMYFPEEESLSVEIAPY